jgi:hypothetical protein
LEHALPEAARHAAPLALFIAYGMPPAPESQTIRNAFLCRGLKAHGFRLAVLSAKWRGGDESLCKLMPDVDIRIECGESPYDRVQAAASRLPSSAVRAAVRSGIAVAAGRLLFPDVRAGWAGVAIRAARRAFSQNPPQVIISASGSFTAHLAAAVLAERWGVPWTAEFGDPWSFNPLPPLSTWPLRTINAYLERKTLACCDLVSVTSESTAEAYREWLGSASTVVQCFPNGFEVLPPGPEVIRADIAKPVGIRAAYIGTASKGSRSLFPVLEAFERVAGELELSRATSPTLRIVGDVSRAFERGRASSRTVSFCGSVPYDRSIQEVQAADLLVLLGNRGGLQVPLKAATYLASGKPILYLAQQDRETDPTWKTIEPFGGVIWSRNEPDAIAASVRTICELWHDVSVAARRRLKDERLNALAWAHIAQQFANAVESLLSGGCRC